MDCLLMVRVFFEVSHEAGSRRRPSRGRQAMSCQRRAAPTGSNRGNMGGGQVFVSTYTHNKYVSTSRYHSTDPCPLQKSLHPQKWPARGWGVCSGNGCIRYEFTIPQPPRCKVSTRACRRHGPYRLLILHCPS